jgi:predicted site-specific integrase-resolvase
MKLSDYARQRGITYRTAWNHFKSGKIENAVKDSKSGRIFIAHPKQINLQKVAIYARVSSNENKNNLDAQAERLKAYSIAKGYQIIHVIKEIGSGVNDNRKKLLTILSKNDWGCLIIEHKDRLTRFGFNYIQTLLEKEGKKIEIVNIAEDDKTDLIQDLVAIVYSFSARMYGLRRSKRKTEKIIECLKQEIERDQEIDN